MESLIEPSVSGEHGAHLLCFTIQCVAILNSLTAIKPVKSSLNNNNNKTLLIYDILSKHVTIIAEYMDVQDREQNGT